MSFHVLVYQGSLAAAASNAELAAITDPEFSFRGSPNHYIFSEDYNLIVAKYNAATATRARLSQPKINGIGRAHIWPLGVSATIESPVNIMDLRDYPLALAQNEELAVEGSNGAGLAEQSEAILFVAPPAWNRNLPRGTLRFLLRATASITTTATAWSAAGALTFEVTPRGGWYALVGAQAFDATTLVHRFIFPRQQLYQGRRLRPGVLTQNATGNQPWDGFQGGMGVLGYFHTFEPPSVEIYARAAAAHTPDYRLDVIYLGDAAPAGLAQYA